MLSVSLIRLSVPSASFAEIVKKGKILSLRWVYAKYFLALAEHALKNFKRTISMRYKLFSVPSA